MKTKILLALAVFAAAITVSAQPDLFRAKEFSVRLAVLNPADLGGPATWDPQAKNLAGFEAGMGYFFTRWAGAEVNVPVWRSDSRCFQSVSAGAMFRLPLDMVLHGRVWERLAPYARVGLGYNECWSSPYNAYIGGGLEVRLNRTFGLFGGVIYTQRGAFEPGSWGVVRPEAGLRLSF
jgi:hypothetical protein